MSHYQTLGVREGANPVEIQFAYKALVECNSNDPIAQIEVNEAFNTLINPQLRAAYDKEIGIVYSLQSTINYKTETPPITLITNPPENKTLTNMAFCVIVGYCAITMLLMVALAW